MRGVFDEPGVSELAPPRDTEITLGAFSLSVLLLVLLGLCGLCFGFGYAIGHRGPATADVPEPATVSPQAADRAESAHAKPSANASEAVVQAATTPEAESQGDSATGRSEGDSCGRARRGSIGQRCCGVGATCGAAGDGSNIHRNADASFARGVGISHGADCFRFGGRGRRRPNERVAPPRLRGGSAPRACGWTDSCADRTIQDTRGSGLVAAEVAERRI